MVVAEEWIDRRWTIWEINVLVCSEWQPRLHTIWASVTDAMIGRKFDQHPSPGCLSNPTTYCCAFAWIVIDRVRPRMLRQPKGCIEGYICGDGDVRYVQGSTAALKILFITGHCQSKYTPGPMRLYEGGKGWARFPPFLFPYRDAQTTLVVLSTLKSYSNFDNGNKLWRIAAQCSLGK